METYVLLRGLEQIGHALLRKPDRLVTQTNVDPRLTILRLIQEELARIVGAGMERFSVMRIPYQ